MRYIVSSMMFVHLERFPDMKLRPLKDFLPQVLKAALTYFDESINKQQFKSKEDIDTFYRDFLDQRLCEFMESCALEILNKIHVVKAVPEFIKVFYEEIILHDITQNLLPDFKQGFNSGPEDSWRYFLNLQRSLRKQMREKAGDSKDLSHSIPFYQILNTSEFLSAIQLCYDVLQSLDIDFQILIQVNRDHVRERIAKF